MAVTAAPRSAWPQKRTHHIPAVSGRHRKAGGGLPAPGSERRDPSRFRTTPRTLVHHDRHTAPRALPGWCRVPASNHTPRRSAPCMAAAAADGLKTTTLRRNRPGPRQSGCPPRSSP
ncbi:hypothetical protein BT67DRAFT_69661 [Trichocladium antarcticum]|uniref:Uncharacterized protein n=1 Tax=Trichocladium antarcticum TaxID=1450529 RepID=A0AAN6UHC2_9PEZI|nr:hypothetical protein BT67DRAFT_69661 [Trichocladium antarcticum]